MAAGAEGPQGQGAPGGAPGGGYRPGLKEGLKDESFHRSHRAGGAGGFCCHCSQRHQEAEKGRRLQLRLLRLPQREGLPRRKGRWPGVICLSSGDCWRRARFWGSIFGCARLFRLPGGGFLSGPPERNQRAVQGLAALENPAPAHRRRALRFGPRDRRLHWRRTAAPSKGGLHESQPAYPGRSIAAGGRWGIPLRSRLPCGALAAPAARWPV